MSKLMLVDGSNLLFQMFYGMPARITSKDGKAVQGTLGFVGALLKTIRMIEPTHLAVFFDGECRNPRHELNVDYKANRTDYSQMTEEDTPFSQLPDICAALNYLHIYWRETTDCEADDWIAGYAKQYCDKLNIVIMSQDSDFFQLISNSVSILRYRGKNSVLCNTDYIQEKLGIKPCQYAAYKSLTGDSSDNIRGVAKVGPKTAAALMNQFGDLSSLLKNTEKIQRISVRQTIAREKERILNNYALIHLDAPVKLPCLLDDMMFFYDGTTTTQVMQAIGLR